MDRLISEKAVLEAFREYQGSISDFYKAVKAIPSAEPKIIVDCDKCNKECPQWAKNIAKSNGCTGYIPSADKWIPVSERLPEEYSYVLLTINGYKGLKVRSGMYYEGGSFHSDTGEFWKATDKEVIAWMPLPDPYKGRK